MADKNTLRKMLDNLIDGQAEQAQTDFHQYLQDVMQDRMHGKTSDDQNDEK